MNTEVNVPLLRKAVEWAEAESMKPRELCQWYQGAWSKVVTEDMRFIDPETDEFYLKSPECGTAYCIAGYADQLATGGVEYTVGFDSETGQWRSSIEVSAREVLNLTWEQADDLFFMNNTIEDVRRIAEKIAGERL